MNRYDMSERQGLIISSQACNLLIKDLRRIRDKLERKVKKDKDKREAEFKTIISYRSVEDIRDAYGWDLITWEQCEQYIALYEQGEEILNKPFISKETAAVELLSRIISDLDKLGETCRFDALTPEQQADEIRRAEQSKLEWENHKKEIKTKLGILEDNNGTEND